MGSFVWGSFADELENIVKKANGKAVENNKRVDTQILYFIKGKCRTVASKCEDSFSASLGLIQDHVDGWYTKTENFNCDIQTVRVRIVYLVAEELGIKAHPTFLGDGVTITWRKDDDNE